MTLHPDTLGIDISRHHLDIHDMKDATTRRIANSVEAADALADTLRTRDCLVVMEATGRYDAVLRTALGRAGVAHARVNPEQARHFARATGKRAKTDAIDARMLADLGQRLSVRPEAPADLDRIRLAGLSRRSEQDDALLAASLDRHLVWLDADIADLESRHPRGGPRQRRAVARRGVAALRPGHRTRRRHRPHRTTARTWPHLRQGRRISAKAIAALAGLAPYNNDSGSFRGKRSVRGGRTRVRQALYMSVLSYAEGAALATARSDTALARFHQRLRNAGKPPKLAIIALARKLLTTLNAIVRQQIPFPQTS